MVAAQKRDPVGVASLEQEQYRHRLDGVVPPVHKVAHEDVARLGALAARAEELEQVVELVRGRGRGRGRDRVGAGVRIRVKGTPPGFEPEP